MGTGRGGGGGQIRCVRGEGGGERERKRESHPNSSKILHSLLHLPVGAQDSSGGAGEPGAARAGAGAGGMLGPKQKKCILKSERPSIFAVHSDYIYEYRTFQMRT